MQNVIVTYLLLITYLLTYLEAIICRRRFQDAVCINHSMALSCLHSYLLIYFLVIYLLTYLLTFYFFLIPAYLQMFSNFQRR